MAMQPSAGTTSSSRLCFNVNQTDSRELHPIRHPAKRGAGGEDGQKSRHLRHLVDKDNQAVRRGFLRALDLPWRPTFLQRSRPSVA